MTEASYHSLFLLVLVVVDQNHFLKASTANPESQTLELGRYVFIRKHQNTTRNFTKLKITRTNKLMSVVWNLSVESHSSFG